ncbi:uncharacterized protein METZ01_LOCUS388703, partial [marine metagenome]
MRQFTGVKLINSAICRRRKWLATIIMAVLAGCGGANTTKKTDVSNKPSFED